MSALLRGNRSTAALAAGSLRAGLSASVVAIGVVIGMVIGMASSAAQAAALVGGLPDAARRPVVAAPTTGADAATLDLASGRIDAVAADGSSISLQGRRMPLHPSQLQVLAPGGQRFTTSQALRPGMRVRFALEPLPRGGTSVITAATTSAAAAADAARRIVLVYIESAP